MSDADSQPAITAAKRLHRALADGLHGEDLRALFTADAVTVEHPNPVSPRGARRDVEQILAASEAGAGLLREQTYEIRSAMEVADTAALRVTWRAVIGRSVGPFREGQVLTAHLAQFVTVRDGRISSIETYDCYEPFG